MNNNEELQKLFDLIGEIIEASRIKRSQLYNLNSEDSRKIPSIEWKINDNNKEEITDYILDITNNIALSNTERKNIISHVKDSLNKVNSVEQLEEKLRYCRDNLNHQILDNITKEIKDYGTKIDNASNKLQEAINKLNSLSKVLGTITMAVSLFTALVSVSTGNFVSTIKIIDELVTKT